MEIKYEQGRYVAYDNGVAVASATSKYYLKQKIDRMSVKFVPAAAPGEVSRALQFPINQRFEFVSRLVKMVGNRSTASAVIVGDGGLGKTHTVISALKDAGLRDISDVEPGSTIQTSKMFRVVKGYSTAKGLFKILYENRNSVIVFDDCDSILKDDDAVNLLKGALDTYDKRLITWNTSFDNDNLPRMFEFTGGVIFISNRPMAKIDQALRTRSMCIDVTMTLEQKLDRMEVIMNSATFLPDVSNTYKRDALNLIRKHVEQAREVSLRTLIAITKIRAQNDADWEDLATYSLIA